MSWLSELFGGSSNTGAVAVQPSQYTEQDWQSIRPVSMGGTPNPRAGSYNYDELKQFDPKWIAMQNAQQSGAAQDAVATAQAVNPAPPAYSGPTAEAKLQALLPSGFENTLLPSSAANPFIESALSKSRSGAQDVITNMIKRGTLSGAGETSGLKALEGQDTGARTKLTDLSNVLFENERAKLRGIASEGYGAAAGQSGETFDPTPYKTRTDTEAQQFLGGFPSSFESSIGGAGPLYDTSGIGAAAGGVVGPRNVQYDPYAQEGGKLTTGLDQPVTPTKKKTTAVF
jgi:hypothetical protein